MNFNNNFRCHFNLGKSNTDTKFRKLDYTRHRKWVLILCICPWRILILRKAVKKTRQNTLFMSYCIVDWILEWTNNNFICRNAGHYYARPRTMIEFCLVWPSRPKSYEHIFYCWLCIFLKKKIVILYF